MKFAEIFILTITRAFAIFFSLSSSQNAKIHNDINVSNLRAAILDCAYTTHCMGIEMVFSRTDSSAHDSLYFNVSSFQTIVYVTNRFYTNKVH